MPVVAVAEGVGLEREVDGEAIGKAERGGWEVLCCIGNAEALEDPPGAKGDGTAVVVEANGFVFGFVFGFGFEGALVDAEPNVVGPCESALNVGAVVLELGLPNAEGADAPKEDGAPNADAGAGLPKDEVAGAGFPNAEMAGAGLPNAEVAGAGFPKAEVAGAVFPNADVG